MGRFSGVGGHTRAGKGIHKKRLSHNTQHEQTAYNIKNLEFSLSHKHTRTDTHIHRHSKRSKDAFVQSFFFFFRDLYVCFYVSPLR